MKDLTLDEMLEIAAEREAANEALLKQQQESDAEDTSSSVPTDPHSALWCPIIVLWDIKAMTTPNWIHNSGKQKNTKGSCKGKLKARKQALQHIKRKLKVI